MDDMLKDPEVLRSIILDHYQYPRNKQLAGQPGYQKVHMASDSCIDDIYVEAKIQDGMVQDVRFAGNACAIGTSSTSIMTELVKGKSVEEAGRLMEEYYKMTRGEEYDADLLGEAVAFQNVYRQPNRVGCATIGWHGLEKLMKGEGEDEGR